MSTQPDEGQPQQSSVFPTGFALSGGMVGGITLRDYFAAAALPAIMSDPWYTEQSCEAYSDIAAGLAADAYTVADAMLAARQRKEP